MELIKDLFAKRIDRHIEEVIKVDQTDETTVYEELQEYILTEAIGEHFVTVYRAIAEAKTEPHEGIGIWVSGFFGSGKSSFAKILGYSIGNQVVCGHSAAQILKEKARFSLDAMLAQQFIGYLDFINREIPTHVVIFDVGMDRGMRDERLTEIMYRALLRELDYAQDFDLAELEMSLEQDGLLDNFIEEFESFYGKPWRMRRKLGRAINEASNILHRLFPQTYSAPDSWAKSIGKGRADITPNLFAERAFELMARRKPGYALMFVVDEVGQYVSRSIEKMHDLQSIIQAFGREGKNRVKRGLAPAPCWIVVTSQEKLNEVVDALESKKIELARLQDRFPIAIDLKQSDISEITSKRVLQKNEKGERILSELFSQHEGRLKNLCRLERTGRNTEIDKKSFIELYPYLPYQIDLCIDIVSGLRLRRGAHRHIGGSNRTMIKQAQQMLIHKRTNLAEKPVGELVTLDKVFELLYAGDLIPSEVSRELDDVPRRLPEDEMAYKVAKAVALLEVVVDLPRTPHNLAVVLHPRLEADSILPEVEAALERLVQAQIVKETDEGYKLLSIQEKNWDTTRRGFEPKPADRNHILKEFIKEIFSDPSIKGFRYQNRRIFPFSLFVNSEEIISGQIPLHILISDNVEEFETVCEQARKASNEKQNQLFWVFSLNEEIHRLIEELYRSREMIGKHEQLAAQGKLSPEEVSCLTEEKVRRDRIERALRAKLAEVIASGAGFFRGVRKDACSLGRKVSEIFAQLRNEVIPDLYPKFELGNIPIKGIEAITFLKAANLNGLPPVFYEPPDGLNLVTRREGKLVPNVNAEICKEILEYLGQKHSYGEKVTGKTLEAHFGGLGYAWSTEVLQLVLAVLLRTGAIEVTYQGRKFREHTEPSIYKVFTSVQAFRQASFSPRKALDLRMLAEAARHYEEITGEEVDIEESAIAKAFKKLAEEDREVLLGLIPKMKTMGLPGTRFLEEFRQTVEGILNMPSDDCVKTLAGEGKSYKEGGDKVRKLSKLLTEKNLNLIYQAKRALTEKCPELLRKTYEGMSDVCEDLRLLLSSDTFYENLDQIKHNLKTICEKYKGLYREIHDKRTEVFSSAIGDIKSLTEWAKALENPSIDKNQLNTILKPLKEKLCHSLDLPEDAVICKNCRATIAQMESDITAVESLKARAIAALQQLTTPEKKIVRVRVSSILGNVLETPEDLEEGIKRLKEELNKLLAEGVRVVLE
ncbi:MAG: BREX system P-loop protein BrxC [Candidatus Desulfofervidaceae bacterium]|nr:BREX system P-loop protein BrxC [Candidatus Desulfofervidaceae bacterium]